MITAIPLHFLPDSKNATDPFLLEAVQKYCEQEFGHKLDFSNNLRTWAVVSQDDSGYVVHGLTSLRHMIDCPVFHVTPGADEKGDEMARTVRDMLMGRAASFLQDAYGVGSRVMVHVAPEKERFWKSFLRMIKAKPASRWEVEV